MNDTDKTKTELINELNELRQQVAEFHASSLVDKSVSLADLESLATMFEELALPAGTNLLAEGEVGQNVYLIKEGELEIIKILDGKELLLATRQVGSLIGELALIDNTKRMATVRARSDSRLLVINQEQFKQLLDAMPMIARGMLSTSTQRWRETGEMLQKEHLHQLNWTDQILQTIMDGYLLLDENDHLLEVNPAYCDMTGYTRAELLTMSLSDLATEYTAQEQFEQMQQQGKRRFETRHRAKDGRIVEVESNFVIVQLDGASRLAIFVRDISRCKQTEKVLQVQTANFQKLLHDINDIVWTGTEGKILYMNPASERIYGRPATEFLENSNLWFEVIHPDDQTKTKIRSQKLFVDGQVEHIYRIIRPNGDIRWLYDRKNIIYDDAGNAVQIGSIATDITELKLAEIALKKSEQRFRTLFDSAPIGITLATLEGELLEANPTFATMLGYESPEKLIQVVQQSNIPTALYPSPEIRELVIEKAIRQDGWHEIETQLRRQDNSIIEARLFYRRVKSQDDSPDQLEGFIEDITERKLAETALQESEAKFRSLVENSPDYISIIDREYIIQFINRVHPKVAMEDVVGNKIYNYLLPEQHDLFKKVLEHVFGTGETTQVEYAGPKTSFWYESRFVPIKNDQVMAVMVTTSDITERKQMEKSIQESRDTLRTIMNATHDAMFLIDTEGIILTLNNTVSQAMGKTSAEIVGRSVYDLLPPDVAKHRQTMSETVIQTKQAVFFQDERAGYWFDNSCYPVFDEQGQVSQIAIVARDITDRKKVEARLLKAQQVAKMGFLDWDLKTDKIIISDEIHHLYGFGPKQEITLETFVSHLHPDEQAYVQKSLEAAIQKEKPYNIDHRIIRSNGETIVVHAQAELICDAEGNPKTLLGTIIDITARKQAEEALQLEKASLSQRVKERTAELRASEAKLQAQYKGIPIPTYTWQYIDQTFVLIDYNDAAESITQGKISDIIGTTSDKMYPDRPDIQANMLRCMTEKITIEREMSYQFATTEKMVYFMVKYAFVPPDMVLVHTEDITARKQAEQIKKETNLKLVKLNSELQYANRLKDEFLANMSHELRAPLNSVLGMSEILTDEVFGPLNQEQYDSVQTILASGSHLLALINDILDLSKIEAGKFELEMETVSVSILCQSSLQFVKQMAFKKQIEVYLPPLNDLYMQGDKRRLKQILINLLSNAVKFTPEGGRIGLEIDKDNDNNTLHLTVWDTGIGIAEEDMTRLFDPFIQLDAGLDRQHAGTGLGLALVCRLTEMHSGTILVKSTVGQGSRFTISLPWHDSPSVPPLAPSQREGELAFSP
ncbi:PAS domain S-box protein, partial [Anaerolineales bacterium HSG6]|nr:PAS domain S-box protein [Anaerolineales bacterium HSG6]